MENTVELKDRVESILSSNPYLAQKTLKLEAEHGRVVLRGVVNSFFQKQMAQESLRHVDGIHEIANELEVSWG